MKNCVVFLIGLFFCVQASARPPENVELGVKGGVNFTNIAIAGPDAVDTSPDGQLVLGGLLAYRLTERIAVGAEALYTKLAVTANEAGLDARLEARALMVPLPIRVDVGPSPGVRFFLNGGPQWTFLGQTVETVGGVEVDDDEVTHVDFGLFLGAGVHVPWGRGALSVEARYVRGLTNVDASNEDDVKTRAFLFLVGYGF